MATGGSAWFLSPWCRHTVQQSGQCSLHITRVAGVTKHGTTHLPNEKYVNTQVLIYVLMLSTCCRARWMLLSAHIHSCPLRPLPSLPLLFLSPAPLPPRPPLSLLTPCPPLPPSLTFLSSLDPPLDAHHASARTPPPLLSSLLVIVTAV